jgi:hypothetical protein
MPEPLIGESITDIDAEDAGEIETDFSGLVIAPIHTNDVYYVGGAELEYRITRRLGASIEFGMYGAMMGENPRRIANLRAGASFALLHTRSGLHLQLEAKVRAFDEIAPPFNEEFSEPTDPSLPYSFGLRAGYRRKWLTLRGGFGYALGESSPRPVPLIIDTAVLIEFARGFTGVEVNADLGRPSPLIVIPEVVLGLNKESSVRLGLGMPILFGSGIVSLSGLARLIVELDRD